MSEHHYHLIVKDLPEEYAKEYPDFTRLVTNNAGHISVNFTEPHTISLCGISCDNYGGEVSLLDVVEFLFSQLVLKMLSSFLLRKLPVEHTDTLRLKQLNSYNIVN